MSYSAKIKNLFSKKQSNHKIEKSNISISKVSSSPKNILVIFPFDENFFRVASYAYRNLPYDKKQINFHYLINILLLIPSRFSITIEKIPYTSPPIFFIFCISVRMNNCINWQKTCYNYPNNNHIYDNIHILNI